MSMFTPIAPAASRAPIHRYNYETIGVNIDITPRTHHDDEVTLALKVEVSSISGSGFGGLPTFGKPADQLPSSGCATAKRTLLAGLIRDDERRVLEAFRDSAIFRSSEKLFAHTKKETQGTDIVLTLTPRIIRVLDLTEADLRPFRVGRDTGGAVIDLPFVTPTLQHPAPPAPNLPPAAQPPAQQPPGQGAPLKPQAPAAPVQPRRSSSSSVSSYVASSTVRRQGLQVPARIGAQLLKHVQDPACTLSFWAPLNRSLRADQPCGTFPAASVRMRNRAMKRNVLAVSSRSPADPVDGRGTGQAGLFRHLDYGCLAQPVVAARVGRPACESGKRW